MAGDTSQFGIGVVITADNQATTGAQAAAKSFDMLGRTVDKVSNGIKAAMSKVGIAISQIPVRLRMARMAAQKAAAGIEEAFGSFRRGAGLLMTSAAIVAPFAVAVNASSQFNAVISKAGAISNATAQEMQILKQQALDLGAATAFSAKQVAEGQVFLGMAGFNVNQQIAAMPGLLNLAGAAQIDLGRAADIASDTLSMFNIAAENTNRVADVMAKVTNTANTNMELMFDSMKYLGPVAKAMNVSFEEASATIGILADNGLKGSQATAALATGLLRLTKPSDEARGLMQKLNLQFFDANGQFIGLSNTIAALQTGFSDLTDEQKLNATATIFGAESTRQILTLMNAQKNLMVDGTQATLQGAEAMREYTRSLEGAVGSAATMNERMLDNLAGAFTRLRSAVESSLIRIGDALEPMVLKLTNGITRVVTAFNAFMSTRIGVFITRLVGMLAGLVSGGLALYAVIGIMIPALVSLASAVWAVITPLLPIIGIVAAVVAGLVLMYKAFKRVNEMITQGDEKIAALGVALAVLMGPIGVVIAGIAAIRRGMQEFNNLMATGEVKGGILGVFQKLGGLIQGVMAIWRSWNGETSTLTESMRNSLDNLGILDWVLNIGGALTYLKDAFALIRKTAVTTWTQIKKAIAPIWDSIKDLGGAIGDLIGAFMSLFGSGQSTTSMFQKLGVFLEINLRLLGFVAKGISIGLVAAFKAVTWVIQTVIDHIRFVIDGITMLVNNVQKIPQAFVDVGRMIVDNMLAGLKSAWGGLVNWLTGAAERLGIADFLGLNNNEVNIGANLTPVNGMSGEAIANGAGAARAELVRENAAVVEPAPNNRAMQAAQQISNDTQTIEKLRVERNMERSTNTEIRRETILKEARFTVDLDGRTIAEVVKTQSDFDQDIG